MHILLLVIVLLGGAALGAVVDKALGIDHKPYTPYKWLVHVTTYMVIGFALATAMHY